MLYKNCAKQIVKKKNQDFIAKSSGHNYAFFFQCLTTGRLSKVIPKVRLSEFGILKGEELTGGNYSEKLEIKDKTEPLSIAFHKKHSELMLLLRAEAERIGQSQYTRKERYYQYLNSEEWKEKREQILERDNYLCVVTKSSINLHVHHISYDNVGAEFNSDLVTLCKEAHEIVHNLDHELNLKYLKIIDDYINSLYDY